MSDVYRLIYTSRSLAKGGSALAQEVSDIQASSDRNNGSLGVTGALLVNDRVFAQVLEGHRSAVEAIFERIQCDTRHESVSILQCEAVAARTFAGWNMARLKPSERGAALLDMLQHRTALFSPIEGERFCTALLALVRASEDGAASSMRVVRDHDGQAQQPGSDAQSSAPQSDPQYRSLDTQAIVLRDLLDEERNRTTALRRELDDARVAMAQMQAKVEATERHRDIWADRSKQMRTELQEMRAALHVTRSRCGDLQGRLATAEVECERLRAHRDIWAERTRSLAVALCREPKSISDAEGSLEMGNVPSASIVTH